MSAGAIPARPTKVVILGAGFAGLAAAKALARAPVEVTLIDRANAHVFWPLLYQVATAELSPDEIAWPVRALVGQRGKAQVALAEAQEIDRAARLVRTDQGAFAYDALIVATGAQDFHFGHEDWADDAPGLKRLSDGVRLRRLLLSAFERAELAPDAEAQQRLITFAIVGGGPTGVELAGGLVELARRTLAGEFARMDPRCARVILIEAGPRLLPAFPERLSAYAERALQKLGVEVRLGAPVTAIDQTGLVAGGERIDTALNVWAAGVRAAIPKGLEDIPRDRGGRLTVGPDLALPEAPEIFVIGDAARVAWREDKLVPGIAPAAKQMGRHAARVVAARARGAAPPPPFAYRHRGDYATIGRRAAIARYDGMSVTGAPAWWLWGLIHVFTLISARNRLSVAASWAYTYLTRQRGARLILGFEDT